MDAYVCVTEEEYKKSYDQCQDVVNRLYDHKENNVFLRRLIDYLGTREAGTNVVNSDIRNKFKDSVNTIFTKIGKEDGRFIGQLKAIGSATESTKIRTPNEFDYLFVLDTVEAGDIEFAQATPGATKPTRIENKPISYCDVSFKPNSDSLNTWKTPGDGTNLISQDNNYKFLSDKVQERFQSLVERAAGENVHVTTKGPAVTLYFRREQDRDVKDELVKVDLSVAIEVEYEHFPEEMRTDTKRLKGRDGQTPPFYIISSGDYWKISECLAERNHIKELGERENNVYKALKVLRDDLSITHTLEDPMMASYLLKVSYIKETSHGTADPRPGKPWGDEPQSHHARSILARVDVDQRQPFLKSAFIQDDPVWKESDRSFLEARRIVIHLHSMWREYRFHGILLTLHTIAIFALSLSNAVRQGELMWNYSVLSSNQTETFPTDATTADCVILVLRPISLVCFIACIFGILYVVGNKYYKRSNGLTDRYSVIFVMYWRVLIYYIVFAVLDLIPLVCFSLWAGCLDAKGPLCVSRRGDHNGDWGTDDYIVYILMVASIVASALISLVIVIHVIVIFSLSKCNPRKHSFEWIFFDLLCACSSRCNGNNTEHSPAHITSNRIQ